MVKRFLIELMTVIAISYVVMCTLIMTAYIFYRMQNGEPIESRFIKNDGYEAKGISYSILIDCETGVQYVVTDDGISVLFNQDGTPIVTEE